MNPEQQQQAFREATARLQHGDAREAEQICEDALREFPHDPNFMCLSGRALIMLGKYAEAEERINVAITMFPEFSRPHVVRGELRLIQGRHDQAADEFRRAVELGDEDPNTQIKLSRALMLKGDQEGASEAVEESMRLDPARRLLADAFKLEKTGNPQEAEQIYRDILKKDPENVDALRLLAGLAGSRNEHRDAEILLKRALELKPDFGRAMADLVNNLVDQEKLDDALEVADRLTRIGSDNPDSWLLRGNAFSASGQYENAINAYRKSLELSPEHPGALSGLAHNQKTIGNQEDAISNYRKCIAVNPYFTEAYWSLANLKTFRFTDEEVQAMEELLEHPHIPDESKIHLRNALGLEYEGRQEYDKAFANFAQCNSIKRKAEYYDSVETEFLVDRTMEVFSKEFLENAPARVNVDVTPIFIVGLPRSGSTLLEQILASHSEVEGTHELSDLARIVREIPGRLKSRKLYPEVLQDADSAFIADLGNAYLERTGKYRSGMRFFIDKNPNNFIQVGLIHLALPQAVFINARRHPLDSCLGTYKQLFAKGQPFSYDLVDVGEYYLQYERLMEHWNEVLPGKVLDVSYEDVIADLETEVRRMLEHCGLSFEAQCLRYHETDRAVKTASSEQVRQPIYRSSLNLWRNYERHLDPLIEILQPVLGDLPASDRPDLLQKTRK
ncbi:MAG: sulfotransferase [Gammaproteobacteria bacterium]|nr:sulfotransferase [Gammaproteobacteria bacterium]